MTDLLNRILFVLMAAAAGFIPGGMIVAQLLRDRPRTGFEGVAETFFGALGGVLIGLLIGLVLSGRLGQTQRLWGILILLILIAGEVAVVMLMRSF